MLEAFNAIRFALVDRIDADEAWAAYDLEGSVSAARTNEGVAKAKLLARFGADDLPEEVSLPEPVMPAHDASWWRARILAVSAALNMVQSELAQAEAAARRAQAERLPDPTLGVYAASEARGDGDIIGGIITIPFPGERRNLEIQRQLAYANAARDRRVAVEMETQGMSNAAVTAAQGNCERWAWQAQPPPCIVTTRRWRKRPMYSANKTCRLYCSPAVRP